MNESHLYYVNSSGALASCRARMKRVKTAMPPDILALEFKQITEGLLTELVVDGQLGARITVARLRSMLEDPASDFRYALIYEKDSPRSYSVFYITDCGEVTWICGPKKLTFQVAWKEFQQGLQ